MVQNGWGYGHGWREVGWPVEFTLKSYSVVQVRENEESIGPFAV